MKTYSIQIQFLRTDPDLVVQVVAHGTNGDVLWAASTQDKCTYQWPLMNIQMFSTPYDPEMSVRGTHDQLDEDEDE